MRRSQSAVMKEKHEHEVEKKCEIKTKCPDLKVSAENTTSFCSKFSAFFYRDVE